MASLLISQVQEAVDGLISDINDLKKKVEGSARGLKAEMNQPLGWDDVYFGNYEEDITRWQAMTKFANTLDHLRETLESDEVRNYISQTWG